MISQHTTLAFVALATFAMGFSAHPRAPQPTAARRANLLWRAQSSPAASSGAERHLANIKQLTAGGENAEAYFSPDGKQLIFQANLGGASPTACDQMYTMNADGSGKK